MNIRRVIIAALLILAAFFIQHNLLTAGDVMSTAPNLLLIVCCAIGFLRGSVQGLAAGVFAGLLKDILIGNTLGYYTFIYMILGYGCGLFQKYVNSELLTFPLLFCGAGDLIFQCYIFFFNFALRNRIDLPFYLHHIMMPEIVYTVVSAVFVYQIIRKANEFLDRQERKQAKRFV
ncbi:MAG: rod shape-determining protein MreD [Lachnospiraceae bacterium]|nr:rod shape-determining protein MreD [Lachnospiraceae bacterium]